MKFLIINLLVLFFINGCQMSENRKILIKVQIGAEAQQKEIIATLDY